MKWSCAVLVGVLLCSSGATLQAQPLDPMPADPRSTSTSTTNIPVTSGAAEVLGTESTATTPALPERISLDEPIDPNLYVCGAGDVFEISFWGQQNFRLRMAADLEGRVFISKVGFVTVSGKTLTEVRTQIKKRVGANYPGLQFDVTLVSPRTFTVHVVDFVKQPGIYSTNPLERVSSLLTRAGGVTGSRRQVRIRHRNGKEITADLQLYEITGDTRYNPFLLDGDVVRVPPTALLASIGGAVRRPGSYELINGANLAELVELAGGFTSTAAKSQPIRVIRFNARQERESEDVPFQNVVSNTPLKDRDSVVVPDADDLQRSILIIGAVVGTDPLDAATTSKRLPFVEGDTVRTLIERAGGVQAPGDLTRSYISRPTGNGAPTIIAVNLEALLVRRDLTKDVAVQMGDTLVVPPMRYSVMVEGAVTKPGTYYYNPAFGIREYLAHAGGRTRIARDLDDVLVVLPSGHTKKYSPKTMVSPGDTILVPERNFTRAEVIQLVIAGTGLILSGVAITIAATR